MKLWAILLAPLVASLALGLQAGCEQAGYEYPIVDSCQLDADCPEGQTCQNYCTYSCRNGTDSDFCHFSCLPPNGHCGHNSDCGEGGRCRWDVSSDDCAHCEACLCPYRATNHVCTMLGDLRPCTCLVNADCAEGQSCTPWGCAFGEFEGDCGDFQDDNRNSLTDCGDRASCEGRACSTHDWLNGLEDGVCVDGECMGCEVESCASDLDCAACGAYRICDPVRACCTPCPDCACL
ncbi:MAG TPA: hypothetical protein PK668_22990 [Myxococcota bacterium]|nr:hypothetical protein [Myxococcota bacterium]HRY95562.1 hypothetical protein [Myxococcota bacterium]